MRIRRIVSSGAFYESYVRKWIYRGYMRVWML